jgi:hypothetical protein
VKGRYRTFKTQRYEAVMLIHTSNAGGFISLLTTVFVLEALLSETKKLPFNVIGNNDKT